MVKNLRLLRQGKGISQQQLASALGLSQQSINKYENHNVEPDISTLIKMAQFFEVSVDYLIGNSHEPTEVLSSPSPEEQKLLADYKQLNSKEKACIKTVMDTLKHK